MRAVLMSIVVALTVPSAALAKDRSGFTAIAAGSFADAEATLNAERAIYPDRPELMLNLAAVYARTGRPSQARALYGDVLSGDDVAMELSGGVTRSSHELARAGLLRLGSSVASR